MQGAFMCAFEVQKTTVDYFQPRFVHWERKSGEQMHDSYQGNGNPS